MAISLKLLVLERACEKLSLGSAYFYLQCINLTLIPVPTFEAAIAKYNNRLGKQADN